MPFLLLDDGFYEHPKVLELSHTAFRLHVVGMGYCARNLTDGHLSARAVKVLGALLEIRPARFTAELVKAKLWKHDETGDGFWIHDYLKHNPTAEQVKEQRDRNAERQRRHRQRSKEIAGEIDDSLTDAPGNSERNVLRNGGSHAAPSPPTPPLELLVTPLAPHHAEDDAFASGKFHELHRAVGSGIEDGEKLRRAITRHKPSYERIQRAIDAANSPCNSRIAVALAIVTGRTRSVA